jgi:hypothetical protein
MVSADPARRDPLAVQLAETRHELGHRKHDLEVARARVDALIPIEDETDPFDVARRRRGVREAWVVAVWQYESAVLSERDLLAAAEKLK